MLRLSHSQLKCFETCQRQYYYNYIMKFPQKEVETKWLDFGKAMHEVLEEFYNNSNKDWQSNIISKWKKYNLEGRMDFNNFRNNVMNGIMLGLNPTATEKKIFLPIGQYHFVMYLDIEDKKIGLIQDWKSGNYSKEKEDDYKKQVICYAYGYFKHYKEYPKTLRIFFNNNNKKVDFCVDEIRNDENYVSYSQILDYEKYVIETGNKIEEKKKGNIEENWEKNTSECFFCGYKYRCLTSRDSLNYKINIKNGSCDIEGDITPFLLEGLDKETRFDLPNKYFIQKATIEKLKKEAEEKGKIFKMPPNYEDIGSIMLFNKKYRSFSYGLLPKVKNILIQYSEYLKKNINLEISDLRDKEVMEKKLGTMSKQLLNSPELRNYQIEAIESFIHSNGMGFIELGTGGGKTLLTAEIIRMLDTKTLWIIDRKELLYQTKRIFEKVLGIECGILGDDEWSIKDITLATIQTLNSRLKDGPEFLRYRELVNFLNSVNLAIVDEAHHASALSYVTVFKELKNTKYRLGTTGTAKRDDKTEPIMFSIIGDVIYSKKTEELIKEGYLCTSECYFYKINEGSYNNESYEEDYLNNVLENKSRNDMIIKIANGLQDKKVLILVKRISHGEQLNKSIENSTYIHGSLDSDKRKQYMADFLNNKTGVLIATISIASEGIDIPDLDCVINASANKADVKSIQTLGRVLRKSEGKSTGYYVDFIDYGKVTKKHSYLRMKILREEGHKIMNQKIDEISKDIDSIESDYIDDEI